MVGTDIGQCALTEGASKDWVAYTARYIKDPLCKGGPIHEFSLDKSLIYCCHAHNRNLHANPQAICQ